MAVTARSYGFALRLGAVGLGVFAAACGDSPEPARSASAPALGCAAQGTDSARAVCLALDTVQALSSLPARVLSVQRQGAHTCIITSPSDPTVLDGMGAVLVGSGGRILSAVVTDSAACGPSV